MKAIKKKFALCMMVMISALAVVPAGDFFVDSFVSAFVASAEEEEAFPADAAPREYPLQSGFSLPARQQAMVADGWSVGLSTTAGRPQRLSFSGGGGNGSIGSGYGGNGHGGASGYNGSNPSSQVCNKYAGALLSQRINLILKGANIRHERQPFASASPCDYYIFALQRLLC